MKRDVKTMLTPDPKFAARTFGPGPVIEPLKTVLGQKISTQKQTSKRVDEVVTELPVALVFNGISHVVLMSTPTHLKELALGFALTESIIESASECFDIELREHPNAVEVHIQISQRRFEALKLKRRNMEGPSGCGLCGIESLDALELNNSRVITAKLPSALTEHALAKLISNAFSEMSAVQPLSRYTGGAHAAAFVSWDGQLLAACEDVGRHNALDKVVGSMSNIKPTPSGFCIVSSRASYELVKKCVQMNIALLATISAPSSLAIEQARAAGLTLLAYCRDGSATRY